MTDGICICGFPLTAHRGRDNESIACQDLRLTPMNATLPDGRVLTARRKRDVHRIVAIDRQLRLQGA